MNVSRVLRYSHTWKHEQPFLIGTYPQEYCNQTELITGILSGKATKAPNYTGNHLKPKQISSPDNIPLENATMIPDCTS